MLGKVLEFWFSESVKPLWFEKDNAFDEEIRDKFLSLYQINKNNDSVVHIAADNLALVILFDQFPRNMFRNMPQSFETDGKALEIAKFSIKRGHNIGMRIEECRFLYMPFMHSEDIVDQNYSVDLFKKLGDEVSLDFAIGHQEIIRMFGRFPHRNHILGRQSTEEEKQFLLRPDSGF